MLVEPNGVDPSRAPRLAVARSIMDPHSRIGAILVPDAVRACTSGCANARGAG